MQKLEGDESKNKQPTTSTLENKENESISVSQLEMLLNTTIRIESDLKQVKRDIVYIKSSIEANACNNSHPESLAERFDLEFPVKTAADFLKLETLLQTNNSFCKEFVSLKIRYSIINRPF